MARRVLHDEYVDPFNAGEPTLPWCEPDSLELHDEPEHDAEVCAFGDDPYDGPTKAPDNYQAPEANEPLDENSSVQSDDGLTPRQRKLIARAKLKEARSSAKPAGTGTRPKRKHPVVKTILIFAVLVNVVPLALSLAVDFIERNDPQDDPPPDFVDIADPSTSEQDKAACEKVVREYLQAATAQNSPMRQEIAGKLSDLYKQSTGLSAEELGVDSVSFANWLMDHFTYEIDSCYVFEDGTANLYFTSWGPSAASILSESSSDIYDYLDSQDFSISDEAITLSDSQKERTRSIHADAVESAPLTSDTFSSVSLTKKGSAWVFDSDEMDEELTRALGIW
ncbi:MAG: hypothetical protein Q4B77_07025 [Coriobacteriaceae bacterium]|nr:hypothetical protein [Coriobacteriaceae bacterium]